MVYKGWASMGGNEVLNNERIRALGNTYSCPMTWIKGEPCTTLEGALSALAVVSGQDAPAPYGYASIADQPWYDPVLPESARFFGAYGVMEKGLPDSTRTAQVTQGLTSGGSIGAERDAVREVRYQAMLIAQGADALDYGLAWLDSTLRPGTCGQHSSECGLTDWEFFSDCPPERAVVTDIGEWEEDRRNLSPNPSFESNLVGWQASSASIIRRSDGGYIGGSYARAASAVTGATFGLAVSAAGETPVTPGETITLSGWVRGDPGLLVRAVATYQGTGTTQSGTSITLTAEWQRVSLTVVVPASATAIRALFSVEGTGVQLGDILDLDAVLIERSGTLGDYFDGSTNDDPNEPAAYRYSWAGAANNSESISEHRSVVVRLQTDAEYAVTLAPYRRYLHDVACISGPFIVQEMEAFGFDGYLVEFVIAAERPWVWSITQDVELPPSLPVIVQDIVYNLAPYPSAELAEGTAVVAVNYSTNPSLETNATGWSGAVTGTGLSATTGRVTGELSSVGTASFRVVATAAAAGTAGTIYSEQEVALGGPAGARYSISMWSAGVVISGTPVLGVITFRAYWRNGAGGTILRTDVLGTVPSAGGAVSAKSITPPVGATHVTVRAELALTSWANTNVIRLYSDALAVTNP